MSMIPGIASVFPEFNPKDILTPDGEERLNLVSHVGGYVTTGLTLLMGVQLFKPGWTENTFVQNFRSLNINGGKQIGGLLLVIHGESNPNLNIEVTTRAVKKTLELFPSSQIEYVRRPAREQPVRGAGYKPSTS